MGVFGDPPGPYAALLKDQSNLGSLCHMTRSQNLTRRTSVCSRSESTFYSLPRASASGVKTDMLCYSPVPVIRLVWCTSYEWVWHTSEMSSRPTWLKFFYSHFSQEFWRTNKICHQNLMALSCSVYCFGGVMIWPLGTLRLSCYILDS